MAAETRDLILDAMECLLGRFGYQKTTLEDIARQAGVGRRTIYLHFSGKEEVALVSIDRVVERVLACLQEIAAGTEPAPERLRRMLIARVLRRFDLVYPYRQSLNSLFEALRPAYMERRRRYFEAEARIFSEILLEGQRVGAVREGDPAVLADTLLHATNSLLPYSLSIEELGDRADVARRAEALSDLLLEGLLSRPEPSR